MNRLPEGERPGPASLGGGALAATAGTMLLVAGLADGLPDAAGGLAGAAVA